MSRNISRIIVWVGLIGLVLFLTGPVIWQLLTSFKTPEQLTTLPPVLPQKLFWGHYTSVFANQPFARIVLNSFLVASGTTLFCLALGLLAAFSLAVLKIKGRTLVLMLILSISMFPPIATVSPLYLITRALGLRDTHLGLIFPYATFALPLATWILTSFLAEIPEELYKAARVDGCSPLGALFKVLLPLCFPGLFTCAILVFIFAWNEFLYALTFTATEKSRTVPVAIALFPGLHQVPWGEIAAASIIVTAPLIGLVFLFQKKIVAGLAAGSVKA